MNFSYRSGFAQRLWIGCMITALVSLMAKTAYACTYLPPTPWFNENVTLLNTNRPSGIIIKQDGHTVSLTNNLDASSFYFNSYNGIKELGKAVQFSSYNNVLSANDYYLTSLEPRNIVYDKRPTDVRLPEPQDIVVVIFLDHKPNSLQFRISYDLYKDYIPPPSNQGLNFACGNFNIIDVGEFYSNLFFVVVIIISLILISSIIINLKQKNISDK